MSWFARSCQPPKSHFREKQDLSRTYRFSPLELTAFRDRFRSVATKGKLSFEMFKEKRRVLGLADFGCIADRIFAGMSKSESDTVTLEEYLHFLDILIHGDEDEQADLCFRIISKGLPDPLTLVQFSDFLLSLSRLSASSTTPLSTDYLNTIFTLIDGKRDGVVDAEEFRAGYREQMQLFEWVNIVGRRMAEGGEEEDTSEEARVKRVMDRLVEVERDVSECLDIVRPEDSTSDRIDSGEGLTASVSCSSDESIEDDISLPSQCPILGDQPILTASKKPDCPGNLSTEATLFRSKNLSGKLQTVLSRVTEIRSLLQGGKISAYKDSALQPPHIAESWGLITKLFTGIQKAAKSSTDWSESIFTQKLKLSVLPLPIGVETTAKVFKYAEYCPLVFEQLRLMYGITNSEYIASLGVEKLIENWLLGTEGGVGRLEPKEKSSDIRYFSEDGKYTLKTVSKEEFLLLRGMLKDYFEYMIAHPNSVVQRVYGIYKVIARRKQRYVRTYFAVVNGLFPNGYEIHRTNVYPPCPPSLTLQLGPDRKSQLLSILSDDCRFLQSLCLADYQLQIGVHRLGSSWTEPCHDSQRFVPFTEMNDGGLLSVDEKKMYFLGLTGIFREKYEAEQSPAAAKRYAENFVGSLRSIIE